jgi:hypothetical protein
LANAETDGRGPDAGRERHQEPTAGAQGVIWLAEGTIRIST